MRLFFIGIILFVSISIVASAQSNFIKGKIINNQKDTLSGYIDYKEWIKSPTEIFFKKSLSQTSSPYSTKDLQGFIIDFNQETYELLHFKLEKLIRTESKTKFESLGKYANRDREIIDKQVFARLLSKGKVNLYEFVDNSEEHFLLKHDDIIEPLIYHIIEVKNNIVILKQYQVQLTNALIDACKQLSIQKTDYVSNELKELIDAYNECFDKTLKLSIKQKEGKKWEYGITAGVGYSTFKHTFPTTYAELTLKGDTHLIPVGGIFFNYVLARGRGRFAILNELHSYSLKSTTYDDNKYNHYNIQYIALQNLFRYKIYVKKPSIYLVAGLLNGFLIDNKSVIKDINGTETKPNARFFRTDEQGLIGGIGISFNRFMLESRYIRGNGFAEGKFIRTPTNRIEFLAKLNFEKY